MTTTHQNQTIMLLDDDVNTLLVLSALLERTRAHVIECEDERCAVSSSEQLPGKIDLLVSDVVLAGSNGPTVAGKVRPAQPLMRLLFISGFSLPELQRRGILSSEDMQEGSVDFLQKPFSSDEFLGRIDNLLKPHVHRNRSLA